MQSMIEHRLEFNNREFLLSLLRARNGCFLSISEGKEHRLGAMNIAVYNGLSVSMSRVIPSKYNSVFLDLLSQRVARVVNGICIVSFNVNSQLDEACMRYILEGILNLLGEGHGST